MATYLIEGTVTAFPELTNYADIKIYDKNFNKTEAGVNPSTGGYSVILEATPGDEVWVSFTGYNLDSTPPEVTGFKSFGPFVIDDIGALV